MRLVLCVDTWGLIGGSERYAGAAAGELAARGHQVHVLAARSAPDAAAPADSLCQLEPAYGAADAAAADLRGLGARVAALEPDAILVLSIHSERAFETLLGVAPVVRFVQDHTPFCPGENKLKGDGSPCRDPLGSACLSSFLLGAGCHGFRRDAQRRGTVEAVGVLREHMAGLERLAASARVLVASDYMRAELIAAGLPAQRVARVPYFTLSSTPGLPAAQLDLATQAFLDGGGTPLVLAPARLALPDKGIDLLLGALAQCRGPWRAVIAGSGPAEGWLRAKARAEGLEGRVHFAGWQTPGAMETLYARCDLVAFPSVWDEPFGLVGLEAMAHSKPVAAFDVGGVREWLVDGETGLLAPRRDVPALARVLESLLADPGRSRRMGAAGRERLQRCFSRELGVQALEAELALAARTTRTRRAA
jgi:glycosyltransferase involved in cell wall biosynthesis